MSEKRPQETEWDMVLHVAQTNDVLPRNVHVESTCHDAATDYSHALLRVVYDDAPAGWFVVQVIPPQPPLIVYKGDSGACTRYYRSMTEPK